MQATRLILSIIVAFQVVLGLVAAPTLASLNNSLTTLDQNFRNLPLAFEPNQGQSEMPAPFYIRDRDGAVYLRPEGLEFKLLYRDCEGCGVFKDTVALWFQGANENGTIEGRDILPGKSNYFIGNDSSRWRTNVPQYGRVHAQSVYPRIDADFYGVAGQLEFDVFVEPGADPSIVRLRFAGYESIELNREGDLVVHLRGGDLIQRRPIGYQLQGSVRHAVSVCYHLFEDQTISFELGAYDRKLPLVIDPSFVYSTRFSGTREDEPGRMSVDSTGSAYITGLTYSLDFPTVHAVQSRIGDNYGLTPDVFISKLNSAGTQLVYSTYLGGSQDDLPGGIAVDSLGAVYITGSTISSNFPTVNALQPVYAGGGDAFLAKLSPSGSALTYSTYIGGSDGGDYGNAIAVDSSGAAYIAGFTGSTNFPVQNAYQGHKAGGTDGFLLKVNPSGTGFVFSTYFGGSASDGIAALAIEASTGNIIVAGGTQSQDFPTLTAFQGTRVATSSNTAFVSKFNSSASALVFSSYLGGSISDAASGLALDPAGDVYVLGSTSSSDFPSTTGALEPFPGFTSSCFITKFTNTGALTVSTFLTSHYGTGCSGIALDLAGNVLVAGSTFSDYPVVGALQRNSDPGPDAFLSKLAPDLSSMIFSTLLGVNTGASGISVDANNAAYVDVGVMGTYPIVTSTNLGPGGQIGVSKIVDDNTCAGTVVSPGSFTAPPSGLSASVHVSTAPNCIWSAFPNTNGPPLNSPDFIAGSSQHAGTGDLAFTVPFTQYGPDQTGHIVVAGRRIDVTQTGLGCAATLPSSSVTLPYTATNNQFFTYNVNAGCPWQAQSNAPWITLTSPTSSRGPAIIQFSVTAYLAPPGPPRSGIISIGGLTFTVNQSTIPPPALSITKNHIGNFPPGEQNATYTVVVFNASPAGPTNAPVTVTENLPNGLALVSMSGTGWSCSTNTCNRSDVLNSGGSYPTITVTVNVAANATSPQVNQVSVSGGGSISASASDLTLIRSAQPKLTVNHTSLNFAYSGPPILATSVLQTVVVSVTDAGPSVGWTATPSQSNILFAGAVYPMVSGVGSGSFQVGAGAGPSGTIIVTLTNAIGSVTIQVNVTKADPSPPFGSFDTPLDNTTGIAGAIPVTGWALDTVEVVGVRIYREPNPNESGLMFIGDATFVEDARPDVAAKYSNTPNQYSAGWGYSMLTNFLPSNNGATGLGNGTYRLHAIATNTFGTQTDLGTRTITVDNAHAKKPFGAIDTPSQGGTVSGNAYVNFGWALTQNPYTIPLDGSSLTVFLDGMPVGHPAYNQYRSDIATLFPGLANSNGAVGFYYIDTTQLATGVHTISWSVTDNAGHVDGVGSRFFSVLNTGTGNVPEMFEQIESRPIHAITLRRGFDTDKTPSTLPSDQTGGYSIEIEELERIELSAGAAMGHILVGGERRPLPIGSTIKDGIFYWQPGPGFLGEYELLFVRREAAPIRVRVLIHPKGS